MVKNVVIADVLASNPGYSNQRKQFLSLFLLRIITDV